ncbi:hypothetical protein J7T55_012822 [Diaporthe amygdali]|uniref:uncharacterized protein n=1 Tax=Phomopsis amygdali TaxID=1214568 RepID=UPI0022FED9C1|nr:uncharacterized protein J7T55_012822 [Diaporthe amygdali]KAJ0118570.1 hypothetical protein J7T55_012822 [Diaporthe amygdali]
MVAPTSQWDSFDHSASVRSLSSNGRRPRQLGRSFAMEKHSDLLLRISTVKSPKRPYVENSQRGKAFDDNNALRSLPFVHSSNGPRVPC